MIGLDITTNKDYKLGDGTEVWGITALQLYSYTIEYNTLVDEKWTGNEQRRAQWTEPRRAWTLKFQKDPSGGRKLEDFFKRLKGKYRAFKFLWAKTYAEDNTDNGGDDIWYYVRMDSDSLQFTMNYMGYREVSITLIEVRNGA